MSVLAQKIPLDNGCIVVSEQEFKEYAAQLQWFYTMWTGRKQMPLTEAKFHGHPIIVDMGETQ